MGLFSIFKRRAIKASEKISAIANIGLGPAIWPDRNYENFAKESYMKNLIAFACIDKIAKAVALVPWQISRLNKDGSKEILYDHYFNLLLNRTNPESSWSMFLYSLVSYLDIAGNSYIEKVYPSSGANAGKAKELWVLRPDRMSIKIDKDSGRKSAWIYEVNGRKVEYPIDPITGDCDILQIKMFHPLNENFGLSIVEPSARKIDTANSMDNWNKSLLDNMGKPGMLLFFDDNLSDEQYKRLKESLSSDIEGSKNAGKTHLIEHGRDAKPYGFSPSEMDWIKSNVELSRSICTGYGVPPQLIGIPDVSTYSNYQEARQAFYEDTVVFYLHLIKSEINAWEFKDNKEYLDYNLDEVPAMQYKRNLRWQRAQKSDFLEINERRALVGYDERPYGDVIMLPGTMMSIEDILGGSSDESKLDNEELELNAIRNGARDYFSNEGFSDEELDDMT